MAALLQVNPADRSLRERGKRRPGKQPVDPGAMMCLVDDPDESYDCLAPAIGSSAA